MFYFCLHLLYATEKAEILFLRKNTRQFRKILFQYIDQHYVDM